MQTQHVFLVGAKCIGAYGGYETFINKLTEYHQHCSRITYHIACKANGEGAMDETTLSGVTNIHHGQNGSVREFTYHNAHCKKICVPNIGPAQAIYYELAALWSFCKYIQKNKIAHPIIYIMACRISLFTPFFSRWIHHLNGKLYINPDGHDWMRKKWNPIIRRYWKISERIMVHYSDLVICDSRNIERYIHEQYDHKNSRKKYITTYISYGAEVSNEQYHCLKLQDWYDENKLSFDNYYLTVGRFVPENNYETILREFMASNTDKSLVLVTNSNEKFLTELEQKLSFRSDSRIRMVKPVYDQELLTAIRHNAFAYIHGHEVGGTNPSLLESMAATKLNLLLDVSFNREVAEDSAHYWTKESGVLASLIDACDRMAPDDIADLGDRARKRIIRHYSWQFIADQYMKLFCCDTES